MMTFHDLGPLGTVDVVSKKHILAKINLLWENFSLKYTAEMADLSAGAIIVLQEALISKQIIKIKNEGDELDRFFGKIYAAPKKGPSRSGVY